MRPIGRMNRAVPQLCAGLMVLLFLGCERPSGGVERAIDPKIIGGSPLAQTLSPQVVRLDLVLAEASSGGRFHAFCSGTIIGRRSVLTAAHCFQSADGGFLSGTVQTLNGSFSIARATVDPNFHAVSGVGLLEDAAVATTAIDLDIPPLPILSSQTVLPGSTITIEGYGLTESGSSGDLQVGTMQVSDVDAFQIYATYDTQSNTCFGDSGGPAIAEMQGASGESMTALVGIISAGERLDCGEGDRSTFTNLSNPQVAAFIAGEVPDLTLR